MKILSQMYLCTRKNSLNIGSHLLSNPDQIQEFFEGLFTIVR